jgi:hypothetical protein
LAGSTRISLGFGDFVKVLAQNLEELSNVIRKTANNNSHLSNSTVLNAKADLEKPTINVYDLLQHL